MDKKDYWTESLTPQKLWAIFFIQLNEGYQINVILPFVVFMIRDFNFSEDFVGIYAGLLTATFAFCQFISSYFWGAISDKYGRKISLLIGSLFSGFAIIIFGTSTNYIQAIAARCIAGVFNGNIGVARAYVADITNGQNRAFAFSIFAIAFSAGIVAGSTCGGSLIHTFDLNDNGEHKQSEGILEWWIFYRDFPYLLPCVIGSIISFISFGFTMIYIHDIDKNKVNKKKIKKLKLDEFDDFDGSISKNEGSSTSKSLPMISMDGASSSRLRYSKYSDSMKKDISSNSLNYYDDDNMMHLEASIIETNTMGTNAVFEGIKAIKTNKGENGRLLDDADDDVINPKINSLRTLFAKTKIIHALIINATIMIMLVAWNAMVPLLLAQTLEMDSFSIGIYMAYNGCILFIFTWWIQPILLKYFNYKSLYIGFGIAMLCIIILFPSITLIPNIANWDIIPLLILTSFIGAFKYAFSTNLFVVSLCFINNSVPPIAMGRANGLAQAVGAGLRGFGPLIGGALWSYSITLNNKFAVYIAYLFMFIPSTYSIFHCWCFIKRNIQKTWTERHNNNNNKL